MQKNLKEWDLELPHVDLSYAKAPSKATGCSSFEALYGINPLTLFDLIPHPTNDKVSYEAEQRAKEVKRL